MSEIRHNPAKTLDILESDTPPSHPMAAIEFEGRWFSIGAGEGHKERANHWDLEAFRILYQFFQLTVTDVSKVPTLPITIAK